MHSPVGTRDIWTYCTVMLLIQLYIAFPAVQAAIFNNALLCVCCVAMASSPEL